VEPFDLPDLAGDLVTLADFRGKQVLLVHWSPACGFCQRIAADLAGLEGKLRKRNAELVLMSYGDAERNRTLAEEHGLSAPILLQEDGKPHPVFGTQGTPVGYLLDEEGRIASALAVGANEVPELARSVAEGRKKLESERSLEESRIERDGLKAGTQAPEFTLENVSGGEVALADYRGRHVLLVFSDPECGPCTALLPDLARLQEKNEIVMISRGDPAENLAKAEEHGLDLPVLLQKGWTLSKQYGIFATPVAFLVDEEGVIARDVARGRDQILALAREMPARKEAPLTL
jgi:peroxiredoxin